MIEINGEEASLLALLAQISITPHKIDNSIIDDILEKLNGDNLKIGQIIIGRNISNTSSDLVKIAKGFTGWAKKLKR